MDKHSKKTKTKSADDCRVCGKAPCFKHCHESEDGLHDAKPTSAEQAGGIGFTVDYRCRFCGQSGAVAVNPKDIQWE